MQKQELKAQVSFWFIGEMQTNNPTGDDLICEVSSQVQCQPDAADVALFISQRLAIFHGMNPNGLNLRLVRQAQTWSFQ